MSQKNAQDEASGWPQFDSQLMKAPYNRGSQGSWQLVHRVRRQEGNDWIVDSAGRGSAAAASGGLAGSADTYIVDLSRIHNGPC